MLPELTRDIVEGAPLTGERCSQALEHIFSEPNCTDLHIASFLSALSARGPSSEELSSFARTMRRFARSVDLGTEDLVDTAGTGGGINTFNISTISAFIAAGAGVPVAKHGNRAMTSRCGSADVLEALGISLDISEKTARRCIKEAGICFLFAPLHHPAMKRVAAVRRELKHKTIFNMLGPLTNPASAASQVIGAYSNAAARLMAEALTQLDVKRAWVVHAEDGMDELSPLSKSRVFVVEGANLSELEFDPRQYVSIGGAHTDLAGGSAEENADMVRQILSNKSVSQPALSAVLLNAAAAIHCQRNVDFPEAYSTAIESLKSGAAMKSLQTLIEVSNA